MQSTADVKSRALGHALLVPQALVVSTTMMALVRSSLSHISSATTKQEFAIGLIRGLGGYLEPSKREKFAQEIYRICGEKPLDNLRPLDTFVDPVCVSCRASVGEGRMSLLRCQAARLFTASVPGHGQGFGTVLDPLRTRLMDSVAPFSHKQGIHGPLSNGPVCERRGGLSLRPLTSFPPSLSLSLPLSPSLSLSLSLSLSGGLHMLPVVLTVQGVP